MVAVGHGPEDTLMVGVGVDTGPSREGEQATQSHVDGRRGFLDSWQDQNMTLNFEIACAIGITWVADRLPLSRLL